LAEIIESPDVQYAEIRHGDDLREIALRELGTAERWLELITINELIPPYIASARSKGVLKYGDLIKLPAAVSSISAIIAPELVFGIDLSVDNGNLGVFDGDFSVKKGVPNLIQALQHHIVVGKRELPFHPTYGCYVRTLSGKVNGETAGQLAAFYVKSAILEDSRVQYIQSCEAEMVGDRIGVKAIVNPISGSAVSVGATV
jgi:hypothetical protein